MTLKLAVTERIGKLLKDVQSVETLSQGMRQQAGACLEAGSVPWVFLKDTVEALRHTQGDGHDISLHQLCHGSSMVLEAPAPKVKSPELQQRLEKLQQKLDDMEYERMVADITQGEKAAEAMRGMLPNFRLQLSFGAHVLVTMFTFFAVAYWGSKQFLGWDDLWAGLLGALGLTFGLLMETMLLIIRTNRPQALEDRYPELFDPAIWGAKGAKQQQQKGKGPVAAAGQGSASGATMVVKGTGAAAAATGVRSRASGAAATSAGGPSGSRNEGASVDEVGAPRGLSTGAGSKKKQ